MRLIRGVRYARVVVLYEKFAREVREENFLACHRLARSELPRTKEKKNRTEMKIFFFLSSLPRCERLDFAASKFSKLPARYRLRRVVTHFT